MRMVVLGAGASFGASSHGDVNCPMVNGIFKAATKAGILSPHFADNANARLIQALEDMKANPKVIAKLTDTSKAQGHLAVLKQFILEQLGIDEKQIESVDIDYEELMALVDNELMGYHGLLRLKGKTPGEAGPADVLEQQMFLVLCGSLIAATRGVECKYHEALARWLRANDMVLSFNYDLLMDRALKSMRTWVSDTGYGIKFHRVGTRKGDDVDWRVPKEHHSDILLLKPHGSLNWLYPRFSGNTVLHLDLHGEGKSEPSDVIYCLEDMHSAFEDDHPTYEWWEKYEHDTPDDIFDMHSLIIPPSMTKPYRRFELQIGSIWAQALEALLEHITELYLIGYSLRPDDLRSAWLFRKAAAESTTLSEIVVINPSDDVFVRCQRMFKPRKVVRGPNTLEAFAKGA